MQWGKGATYIQNLDKVGSGAMSLIVFDSGFNSLLDNGQQTVLARVLHARIHHALHTQYEGQVRRNLQRRGVRRVVIITRARTAPHAPQQTRRRAALCR